MSRYTDHRFYDFRGHEIQISKQFSEETGKLECFSAAIIRPDRTWLKLNGHETLREAYMAGKCVILQEIGAKQPERRA